MLGHLVRKEILDQFQSRRFLLLGTATGVIIWLSLFSGYQYYQYRLRDDEAARAGTEARIRQIASAEDMDRGDPFLETTAISYLHHRPLTALVIFVRGLDPVMGRSVHRRTTKADRPKYSAASTDPILGAFLPLDLAVVAEVVMTLMALMLCYDAVSGEKEAGTLRLMSSFPVPRASFLLAKLVGSLVPILAAFGLSALLGTAILLLLPDVVLAPPELLRLAGVFAAFVILMGTFVCMGLMVSSLTRQTATSLVVLLALWVGYVLFVPSASLIAANLVRPAPSTHEFKAEEAVLETESGKLQRNIWREWTDAHGGSEGPGAWWRDPETYEEGMRFNSGSWAKARESLDSEFDALRRNYENRYAERLWLARLFARTSPTFGFREAVIRLSATGWDAQQRFMAAYRQFGEEVEDDWFINAKLMVYLRRRFPEKYPGEPYDVSDQPRLVYREGWPAADLEAAGSSLMMTAMWGLGFFAIATVGVLRYDVR